VSWSPRGIVHRTALVVVVGALALSSSAVFAVAGDLDRTFSTDGKAVFALGAGNDESVNAVAVQPDGRIVAIGIRSGVGKADDLLVTRVTPKGALDRTFSGDGWLKVNVPGSGYASAVALQDDGKIVVVGEAERSGDSDVIVMRLTSSGRLDSTFSGDGMLELSLASGPAYANAVLIVPSGAIVVAGSANGVGGGDMLVLRLTPAGRMDRSFSGDGKRFIDVAGMQDAAQAIERDGSKLIVAGGALDATSGGFAIARLTNAGGSDTSFSGDGVMRVEFDPADDEYAFGVVVNTDGSYLLGGQRYVSNNYQVGLVRITAAGVPDPTFGGGDGIITSDPTAGGDYPSAFVGMPNGKVLIAGANLAVETTMQVLRYRADGSLDPTFSGDGIASVRIGSYAVAYAMATTSAGKIVVAGRTVRTTDDLAFARLQG